ncbi:MAG TPA: polysialic acid transporter [Flavobacteriales bacterium]|nr:polysialic acid transporter [Flavobacteriales bacterium]
MISLQTTLCVPPFKFLLRILSLLALILAPISSLHAQTQLLQNDTVTGTERESIVEDSELEDTRVFGASLFETPQVDATPYNTFNQDYRIQVGDLIRVQIWGALAFQEVLPVDAQGNIFLPEIGPLQVLGLPNSGLTKKIDQAVAQVYTKNIRLYANLETSQEVRVYVAGYVKNPGLYGGPTSENLINYLKLAGGIDPARGSFIKIEVKRGQDSLHTINLYDFLTQGEVPLIQFADGDVIFVSPIENTIEVSGLTKNTFQFEFSAATLPGTELLGLARPDPIATTAVVKRSLADKATVFHLDMNEIEDFEFLAGDHIIFSADRKKTTLLVKIEGEHDGDGNVVMPYGSTVGDLFEELNFSEYSNTDAVQLFRQSVKQRQKEAILASLQRLVNNVLSTRSSTTDEARLRAADAELLLQFVDRARNVEPLGQVVLSGEKWRDIRLEEDDRIVIPGNSKLVMVQGEVTFPNTQVFRKDGKLMKYIDNAGGFTENAEKDKIVILRANGQVDLARKRLFGLLQNKVNPGDEVMVLPKVDKKYFPLVRDTSQIIYNLAIATKVILDV